MRKLIPPIIIIAMIIGLGTKVLNDGTLFNSPVKDDVTKYVEENKNEEAGKDIENAAESIKEFLGLIAEGIFSGEKHVVQEETVIKGSEEIINKVLSDEKGLEEVELVYVVDGDTLIVIGDDGLQYKVRLIGIDTPESVHADETKNNQYGELASDHTKELLKDITTLYLEYDEMTTDIYNRTLAYVWLSPDTSNFGNMLNAKILYDGYAADKVYEPNDKYMVEFKEIRNDAEKNERGLWSYIGYKDLVNGG